MLLHLPLLASPIGLPSPDLPLWRTPCWLRTYAAINHDRRLTPTLVFLELLQVIDDLDDLLNREKLGGHIRNPIAVRVDKIEGPLRQPFVNELLIHSINEFHYNQVVACLTFGREANTVLARCA